MSNSPRSGESPGLERGQRRGSQEGRDLKLTWLRFVLQKRLGFQSKPTFQHVSEARDRTAFPSYPDKLSIADRSMRRRPDKMSMAALTGQARVASIVKNLCFRALPPPTGGF